MMSGLIPSDYTYDLSWGKRSYCLRFCPPVTKFGLSLIRMSTHPRLGAIVFGEGIINSALSIVLFKTFLDLYQSGGCVGKHRGGTCLWVESCLKWPCTNGVSNN